MLCQYNGLKVQYRKWGWEYVQQIRLQLLCCM